MYNPIIQSTTMEKFIYTSFKKYMLPRGLVLLTDLAIVAIGFPFAYLLRFNFQLEQISFEQVIVQSAFIILPLYLFAFLVTRSYRGIIRHSSFQDALRFFVAIGLAATGSMLVAWFGHKEPLGSNWFLPYSVVLIHAILTIVMLLGFRLVVRNIYYTYAHPRADLSQVLIFGAGEMGMMAMNVIENDNSMGINVAGFIDDKKSLQGKQLLGKPIYTEAYAFRKILKQKKIKEIILAISELNIEPARKRRFFDNCLAHGITIRETPPITDWINGKFETRQIKKVSIEDLLWRKPIKLDQQKISEGLKGAVVLVTGAAGSIGSEIIRQLLPFELKKIILLDQAESALYDLQNELSPKYFQQHYEIVVASVDDPYRMHQVFEKFRPQYVFNAAAYKHVPLMEAAPYEAIRVNVGGTRVLANLSVEFGVEKFVMISTDKAVNPTNVMGASKRICEIYIQALAQSKRTSTQFITTRFGNVLGSNGSVVPLFRKQIEAGGPVTITHPDIIRYFMTIPEACQLVLEAGFMGRGGEIYVFDMGEPVKIYDLAVKMISLAGLKPKIDIPIVFTGLRPGEKLFEELLSDEENTISTNHPKIKAARVRKHQFAQVKLAIDALLEAIKNESQAELVCRMKALVPEFISQNSEYSQYDLDKQQIKELNGNGTLHVAPNKIAVNGSA
jgi:FlaA1/EpsC-like NDP-sugar epimerase